TRKIERSVEFTLRGRTISESRQGHHLIVLVLGGVGCPNRVEKLGSDRAGETHDVRLSVAPVGAQLPPLHQVLGVSHQLIHQHLEGHTPNQAEAWVPVRGVYPVGRGQRITRPDLACFLSRRFDEKSYPPLPLQEHSSFVESTNEHHVSVH